MCFMQPYTALEDDGVPHLYVYKDTCIYRREVPCNQTKKMPEVSTHHKAQKQTSRERKGRIGKKA